MYSLFRWFYYFPYRCKTRLTALWLNYLHVDFSPDVDRRFPTNVGHGYQPTYDAYFHDGIKNLPIPIKDVRLLDAGCGKGAILFFAKRMGIAKVGGVELAEELCAICVKNMRALGYQDIAVFHKDATLLKTELDEYNVFYMFNPFPADPMRGFLRSVAESAHRMPRSVYVIYHNPIFPDACRDEGFVMIKEVLTRTYFGNDKPTLIFEYRAMSSGESGTQIAE